MAGNYFTGGILADLRPEVDVASTSLPSTSDLGRRGSGLGRRDSPDRNRRVDLAPAWVDAAPAWVDAAPAWVDAAPAWVDAICRLGIGAST